MTNLPLPDPRQRELYWRVLVELKVAAAYIRRYRDRQAGWQTRIATLRAIAASGSIAGWAIWHSYAFVWGAIIAASQVIDALQDVFPFTQTRKAASDLTAVLDGLFIDAQVEWEGVLSGAYGDDEIVARRQRLMKLGLEAETKYFPDGLVTDPAMFELAKRDAEHYVSGIYGERAKP